MRILDRHIIKSIVIIFFTTIFVFCLLYVLIDSAVNLDEFLDRKVPLSVLGEYYLWFLPTIFVQTSFMACLIAILFTFTNLNAQNEIVVLRSSGMNFWQITRPAICFGLIVSAMIFYVNERFVPEAEAQTKRIKNENLILEVDRKKRKKNKVHDLTFYGLKNRLYFIDTFDPVEEEMHGITIVGYDNQQNVREKIVALDGKWTGINWKFFKCHITQFDESINVPTRVRIYDEKLLAIEETPEDFLRQRLNVDAMNIQQLKDYIQRFADSGATRALHNLEVDLHQKIAFPFGNIVIVLLGLPLSLMGQRRKAQTFTALLIAVAIGFLYHVCNAVGLALGKGGLFSPFLSAWMAPLIFTGIAIYLIKTKF